MNLHPKSKILTCLAIGTLIGCTPVEEDVLPTAAQQVERGTTPAVMLVVDTSGSMNRAVHPERPECPADCGVDTLCPAHCPTWWTELQSAVSPFIKELATSARLGLTTYPADGNCLAPSRPRLPILADQGASSLEQHGARVDGELQSIQMGLATQPTNGFMRTGGASPIGNTLAALAENPELIDSEGEKFVVLLTDGLPNCNENNPVDASSQPEACFCTAVSCTGEFSRKGCLDADATVTQIERLRERDVRTIVVAMGPELLSPQAQGVLARMASAGGFVRSCPGGTDAECGFGGACSPAEQTCTQAFFTARERSELESALQKIASTLSATRP